MSINKLVIAALVIATLLVLTGMITYLNNVVDQKDRELSSLQSQIPQLNSQISSTENQINNLTLPKLVVTITTQEIWKFSQEYLGGPNYTIPYDFLQVSGSITNTGGGTAYDVGLHVIGYDMNGLLETNVTVPLGSGFFGSDNSTAKFANASSLSTILTSEQVATITENVIHEGIAYNWTVTPVWATSPATG